MSQKPIPPTSSSDLKFQLGELQRKFAPSAVKGSRNKSEEPQIHLPPTLLNTKQQHGGIGQIKNTSSKTVDFLGDLSDGLLVESRRLAYENKQYKSLLQKSESDITNLKKQLSNLNTVFEKSNAKEEELNDKNWELEVKIQQLQLTLEKIKNEYQSYKTKNSESEISKDNLKLTLDGLKLENNQLKESYNSKMTSLHSELSELKESNENLNDENDLLHKKLVTLKEDFNAIKVENDKLVDINRELQFDQGADTTIATFDDSIIQDPLLSAPSDAIRSLDTETLQRNLSHAYTVIKKLRTQNLRFKNSSPRSNKSPSKSSRNVQPLNKNFDTLANNSLNSVGVDSWENYEDDSFAKATPFDNVPKLSQNSDSNSDDDDLIDDYNNEFNLSDIVSSSPNKNDSARLSKEFEKYILVVPHVETSPKDVKNIVEEYKSFQTIPITESEYNDLLSQSPIQETFSSSNNIISSKYGNNKNLKLFTTAEMNCLTESINEKEDIIAHLKTQISELEELLHESQESYVGITNEKQTKINTIQQKLDSTLKELKHYESNEKETQEKLDTLKAQASSQKLELDELKNQIDTPAVEYIKEKSKACNLVAVSLDDFENLKTENRLIKLEIAELQHVKKQLTVTQKDLSETQSLNTELTAKLYRLEETLDTVNKSLSEKEAQLDQMNETVVSPDINYIKSKASNWNLIAVPVSQFDDLNGEREILKKKHETLQSEFTSLKSDHSEICKQAKYSEEQYILLKHENAELSNRLESVKEDLVTKQKQILDLENLEVELLNVQSSLDSTNEAKAQLESEITNVKLDLENSHDLLKEKENEIKMLNSQIETPDLKYIEAKVNTHGLRTVSIKEYNAHRQDLMDKESQLHDLKENKSNMELEINQKRELIVAMELELANLQILKTDFESQGSKINELQKELDQRDKVVSELESAQHDLAEVRQTLHFKELELTKLQHEFKNPSAAYIKENCPLHNLVAFPVADLEVMNRESADFKKESSFLKAQLAELKGANDKLKSNCEEEEQRRIFIESELEKSRQDFNDLSVQLETPALDYLKAKASKNGLVSIPIMEYDELKQNIRNLENDGKDLQQSIENPSIDYVKKHCRRLDYIALPNNEYSLLKQQISARTDEIEKLEQKLDNPSLDYIKKMAPRHELSVVSQAKYASILSDLSALKKSNEAPDPEYIKQKASLNGLVPLPVAEHESLLAELLAKTNENQSLVKDKVEMSEQIKKLKEEEVLLGKLREKLKTKENESEALKHSLDNPGKEYLELKSNACGLIALPVTEHEKLTKQLYDAEIELENRNIEIASLRRIKQDLELQGEKLVSMDLHDAVQSELTITKDKLREAKRDLETVNSELTLETSKIEILKADCAKFSLAATKVGEVESELKSLKAANKQLEAIERNYLELQTAHKTLVAKCDDFEKCKLKLETAAKEYEVQSKRLKEVESFVELPNKNYIEEKSTVLGLVTLSGTEYEALKKDLDIKAKELNHLQNIEACFNDSKAKIEKLEKNNLKLTSDLDNLHNVESTLSETKSQLEAKERELKTINETLADPPLTYIENNASKRGLIIVSKTKHDSLLTELTSFKNSVDEVEDKYAILEEHNNKTIAEKEQLMKNITALKEKEFEYNESLNLKQMELHNAKSQIDEPDKAYIKSKAEEHGLVVISTDEYESTKHDLEIFSKQRESDMKNLNDKVAELGKIKHERDGLVTELAQLKSKSAEDLQLKTNELSAIRGLYENPSTDYLKVKASGKGFTLIEVIEHQRLCKKLNDLTKEINQKSHEIDSLQVRIKTLESPSKEYIETRSNALGFIPIPIFEHNKLVKDFESKDKMVKKLENENNVLSKEFIEFKESREGLISRKEEIISRLQKQIDEPSLDYIKSKSTIFDSLLVSASDYQNFINDVEIYKTKLASAKSSLEDKDKEIKNCKALYITASAEVDQYKSEVDNMRRDLADKDKELETHKSSLEEMDQEIAKYKIDLQRVKELLVLKEKEIEECKHSNAEKHKDLTVAESSLSSANEKLVELEALKISTSKELSDMGIKLQDLEKQLVDCRNANTQLAAEKEGMLKIKNVHENELQDKIVRITTQQNQFRNEVESLKAQLTEKTSLIGKLQEEIEQPDVEYIKLKSKIYDLLPITSSEYESMNSELTTSRNTISALKKDKEIDNFGETSYPQAFKSHNANIEQNKTDGEFVSAQLEHSFEHKSRSDPENFPADENVAHRNPILKELDVLDNQKSDKNGPGENDLEQLALARGFVLLPLPVGQNFGANSMQKSSSIATITAEASFDRIPESSLNAIINSMNENGYKCLPVDEYEVLLHNETSEAIDFGDEDIANVTLEAEEILSQMESKKHKLKELTFESERSNNSSLRSSRASSISVHDVLQDKEAAIQAKKDSLTTHLESLKKKKAKTQKQINRVSVTSFDSNIQSTSQLNSKLDKVLSKINDEIELASIELNSQESALIAVKAYIKSAQGLDFPALQKPSSQIPGNDSTGNSDEQLSLLQNDVIDLENKYQEKVRELNGLRLKLMNPNHLVSLLTTLGYNVSKDNSTIDDVNVHAESYITESRAAIEPELRARASKLGLTLIPVSDLDKFNDVIAKDEAGDVSFSDLQWKAHELGYELIKKDDMQELRKSAEKAVKLPEDLNIVDLQMYANKLNVKVLSDEDIKHLKKRPITSKELAHKAEEMNLVVMGEEEANELKLKQPITAENISQKAKDFGLLCVAKSQFIATTVTRVFDPDNVVVLPNSYYQKLLKSHELAKKNKNYEALPKPTIPEDQTYSMPTSPSTMSISNIDTTSLRTVNTVISNKQEIIAAVAQTIIGEYLYKYYRKLGPLSSIADSRHERYFWVHPYSLTLYWSNHNPVLADPGKTQIKAMSIVSIQSIDDNNPLPPGIYHKSILVKSHDKIIKLTCPTRQRHNIWFNSLKYLIDKSTENWISDDSIEDQYSQAFQLDKKFELDRAHSMNFRHSQPKNVSFKSLEQNRRISSVPTMRTSLRK